MRGLYVLAQFDQQHAALSMSDLIKMTDINKATMYRIVTTLEKAGYLEYTPQSRQYRPSIKVLNLGFAALSRLDVRQLAHPYLVKLAETMQLTASLGILDGMKVIYIDRIRSQDIVGVVLGIGSNIPAHCSSMGKSMLAFLPQDDLETRLTTTEFTPCTAKSIVEISALQAEMAQIRTDGVAYNIDELAIGLRAVAAPIFDRSGNVIAAINVSGSQAVITDDRARNELSVRVRETADQITNLQSY